MRTLSSLLVCAVLAASCARGDQGGEQRPPAVAGTAPERYPLKRTQPRYPTEHARARDEGWVRMNIAIGADGSVSEPIVEYATSPLFASSAVRCVQEWEYPPLVYEGRPVARGLAVTLSFGLQTPTPPLSAAFSKVYADLGQRIAGRELALAEAGVAELLQRSGLSLRERAYAYALDADLRAQTGDADRQAWSLRRADSMFPGILDPDTLRRVERSLVAVEFAQQHLRPALAGFETLRRDTTPLPDTVLVAAARARERAASAEALSRPGRLATREQIEAGAAPPVWLHGLLRHALSFRDVNGRLEAVDFRCTRHRAREAITDGRVWSVPEAWGECSVYVYGEPGTTFTLLEPAPDP